MKWKQTNKPFYNSLESYLFVMMEWRRYFKKGIFHFETDIEY